MIWIILGIVVVVGIWVIGIYNKLVRLRSQYEEAFSGMDVYMKKRYDLIPNLVETVKGYAAHEKDTLQAVVEARNQAVNQSGNASVEDRLQSEADLTDAISRLMVVVEQYPQLKADTQFLNLQGELSTVETDIAQSRKYYNGTVRQFNAQIAFFPASLVAAIGKFVKQPYFELENPAAERQAPSVKF
jgi:LemA protein